TFGRCRARRLLVRAFAGRQSALALPARPHHTPSRRTGRRRRSPARLAHPPERGPSPPRRVPRQHRRAAMSRRLRRVLCLEDFEAEGRRFLPRPIFGFVAGAAETNASLRDNRAAFHEYAFIPRVLNDVSKRKPEVTLFGRTYAAPFGI